MFLHKPLNIGDSHPSTDTAVRSRSDVGLRWGASQRPATARDARLTEELTTELDLRTGELRKRGTKIRLQQQPFRVLALLLERRGDVVTREELRRAIWPDTAVEFEEGLDATIYKLRNALGDSAEHPRFVETLPRRGYRFIGSGERVTEPEGARDAPVPEHPAPEARSRRWIVVSAGALAAVVALSFSECGIFSLAEPLHLEFTPLRCSR